MAQRFQKTTKPEPGDLMFYWVSNELGRLGMMYLGPGNPEGQGVCVGIGATHPGVQIVDSRKFKFGFEGYYRVEYGKQ